MVEPALEAPVTFVRMVTVTLVDLLADWFKTGMAVEIRIARTPPVFSERFSKLAVGRTFIHILVQLRG